MRVFAGDMVPGLALVAHALPRPWVLPDGIGRTHRDRLVRVLHTALQGAEPALRLAEVHWGERELLPRGRVVLPPVVLLRWRVTPLPDFDRQAVMREARDLHPGPTIFDFGRVAGLEFLGWLGPLKREVLHRIIDAIEEYRPVHDASQVSGFLHRLASHVISPVDLIDAADIMIERIALGQTAESAYAEACAHVVVNRLEDEPRDEDASMYMHALAAVATDEEVSDEARVVLRRVGLMEADAPRLQPVAELTRAEGVMPRVNRLILARFPLRGDLDGLVVDMGAGGVMPMGMDVHSLALRGPAARDVGPSASAGNARVQRGEEAMEPTPDSELLRAAQSHVQRGGLEHAARLVFEAVQDGRSDRWSQADVALAINILVDAASESMDEDRASQEALYQARAWSEAAVALSEGSGLLIEQGMALEVAASAAVRLGDPDRARVLLEKCIRIAQRLVARNVEAQIRVRLGNVFRLLGHFDQARDSLERGLSMETAGPESVAWGYAELGRVHDALGDIPAARDAWTRAFERYRALDDESSMADASLNLAFLAADAIDFEAAERWLQHAAGHPDARFQLSIDGMRGVLHHRKGDWDAALEEFERVAERARELGDDVHHGFSLKVLGDLHFQAFNLAEARTFYDMALEHYRALGDVTGQSRAQIGLGHVSCWTGDLEDGRVRYERAAELAISANAFSERIRAQLALATLAIWNDETARARGLYETLLEEEKPDTPGRELASLVRLGLASLELFEGRDPGPWLDECETLLTEHPDEVIAWTYRVLDAARAWQERPDDARSIWSEAAAYFERARYKISATAVRALIQVLDGDPLDEIARVLANTTTSFHPLPERVRRAETRDAAIRAIIGYSV